jgi:hypothetical protein
MVEYVRSAQLFTPDSNRRHFLVKRRIDRHGPPYLIGNEVKAKSLVGGD